MKSLRIKNTPDGLRLARALVGSFTETDSGSFEFVGVTKHPECPFVIETGLFGLSRTCEITIPLDTIQLCQYAALVNKVDTVPGFELIDGDGNCYRKRGDCDGFKYLFNVNNTKVTLDLDWCKTLDGVEVE